MKKLNLLLLPVLFSSLLIGCGMKGPLYNAPKTQTIEKEQPAAQEEPLAEQNNEILEEE